jgi:putative nucleotidyltransferase with HDIG domain
MAKVPEKTSDLYASYRHRLRSLQSYLARRYLPQAVMATILIVTTAFMFPSPETQKFAQWNVNDVYTAEEIIAPFTFHISKSEEEITRDRKAAEEKVPYVFTRADSIDQVELNRFDRFFQRLQSVSRAQSPDSTRINVVREILNDYTIVIEDANLPLLIRADRLTTSSGRQSDLEAYRKELRRLLLDTFAIGILDLGENDIPDYVQKVSIETSSRVMLEEVGEPTPIKIGYQILTAFLRPNLIFDREETDKRINEVIANVPISKGLVLENERIINTHDRVTAETLEKLHSLATEIGERQAYEGGTLTLVLTFLGEFLFVALAMSFVVMFLLVARREMLADIQKMLMVFLIFMFIIGFAFLMNEFDFSSNLKFLIPISIASMLLLIFCDSRTSFVATVSLSVIIAMLRGNDIDLLIISLFVGTVSTFAVREIRSRSWIVKGMLIITLAYIVSIGIIGLMRSAVFSDILEMWLYGVLNGIFSPIITLALMVIFEYTFKFTTNSTLLELSDLNKPLLRQLAISAPGTYHHSIMVGNLAEAASEAIGANALLARVAAYYHDIGKMEKAEYFVENQKGGRNPHEKLAPSMSSLILINHVKRGLEMAEEYRLPYEIRDFIPQHHGTSLIKFFYQKATEHSEDGEVEEANYRYPGPKPQTKESGILMLADAVEAGTRSLKDPSVSRIRSMVNSFTNDRLTEKELDECPLTIKELKVINESFVNILTGMHHARIEYPDQEKKIFRKVGKKAVES